jgi:multiple sugar transport system permease protein
MQLSSFADSFRQLINGSQDANAGAGYQNELNEAIFMAGTIITILPLLLFYFVLQRWFVEGIDKAGLTGQ